MLKRLTLTSIPDKLPVGTKTLSLDPEWGNPPVNEIETALLRSVAFPEFDRLAGLAHRFVVLDPPTAVTSPGHEDLVVRLTSVAERMRIPTVAIGRHSGPAFGTGGVAHSVHQLSGTDDAAFAAGVATLHETVQQVLTGAPFSHRRHLLAPRCDAAMLAILLAVLAQLPPEQRPFVHVATRWSAADMPNADRFGPLDQFGKALHQLNSERATTFVYAWSRRLAQRLTAELGLKVRPLEPPPEFSLADDGEPPPDRFTVGYFGSAREEGAFERIPAIIRAANQASSSPRRTRFVVLIRPDDGDGGHTPAARALLAELAAIPERNVTVIGEALPRPDFFAALKQVDAVLLPYCSSDGGERFSTTAQHAMAAGKLIFTYEDVSIAWTVRARVLAARDDRGLGEVISDISADLGAVRTAARAAKATYWSTLRPSRLFAELLYGPTVIGGAKGLDP